MLEISVLGPVAVRIDGLAVKVPGGKSAELLVRLALEPGRVVGADRLIDELWGEGALGTSRNTLQSKVARLRRSTGCADLIESVADGYRLVVDPSVVDATALLADAVEARRRLDDGDVLGAAEVAERGLDACGGDLLPAAGDAEWAQPHRARFEEARAELTEVRFRSRLQLGGSESLVGELADAVAASPFREALWELLVLALYREGRQAEALDAYQRARRTLADELGLDPGPALRTLEQQVLAHDPALLTEASTRARSSRPGNVPALVPVLVGRHRELLDACELVTHARFVEVLGPGGVGKTALALGVLHTVAGSALARGGAWLVRLESATSGREVVDAARAALDVAGPPSALFERLKGEPKLVVLDNCEHVVDAAADLAMSMLSAGEVRVLCTSQQALGLEGGARLELEPLALDDAVALFRDRAARQRRPAAASGDDVVRDLCRSLDGLPLAIELAAARTRTLSVEQIAQRIEDRFGVLTDPTSRKPERRRALRATIGWSYDLLFPDDQRGLWALGAFAGSASLEAVEHVLAALDLPPGAALDVIDRLAARSLVVVDGGGPGRDTRYRLLDSIKAFAREACAAAGWTHAAGRAHATWYADRAAESTAGVRSGDQASHLAFARDERPDIDAALAWCASHEPTVALDIATGFGWAWVVLGDSRGAQRILEALAAVGDAAPADQRIDAMLLASWINASQGALEVAESLAGSAIDAAHELNDVERSARGRCYLAYVVSHGGDWARGMGLTDAARAGFDQLDRPWDQVANELFAARAAISAADLPRAVAARERLDRWLPLVDDPWLAVRYEAMLGELARVQRRFADAVTHIRRAAEISGRLGFAQTEAYQTASLGRALWQAGNLDAAAEVVRRAVALAEATGDVRMAALARVHLGRMCRGLGEVDEAVAVLTDAVTWHRAAGGGEQALLAEVLLAATSTSRSGTIDVDELGAHLDAARRSADAPAEVFALDALGLAAARAGDAAGARLLLTEADRRMEDASHFVSEVDRVDRRAAVELDPAVAPAR